MQSAASHPRERARLAQLHAMGLLDTEAEEAFDRLTRLAQALCGVPIALISLVDRDRQWFKSKQGLSVAETDRKVAFCAHTILDDRPLIVEDARRDPRFWDNPLVTGEPDVAFYAGVPLRAPGGLPAGTLCVIDTEARAISAEAVAALSDLAAVAEDVLALRQLAMIDSLTGLHNRRGFMQTGTVVLELADRERRPLTLAYLDLDGLKTVNDNDGHEAGDELLVTLAGVLARGFRGADTVARLGGDEFAVLLFDADETAVPAALQRFLDEVEAANRRTPSARPISVSIGWACRDHHQGSLEDLLAEADAAMYEARADRTAPA
jgi:diguanylate cyclase (GGDEF)-like protein